MVKKILVKRQYESQFLVQLVIDQKKDQVVGAACLSMKAGEMINYLRLFVKHECSANEFVKHSLIIRR